MTDLTDLIAKWRKQTDLKVVLSDEALDALLDVAEAAQHYRDTEHSTPEILWGTLDRLAEVGNDE